MSRASGDKAVKIMSAGSTLYGVRAAIAARDWTFRIEVATDHGHDIHEAAGTGRSDADIVIIPADMLADLSTKGRLASDSARDIGWTGIGIAVRAGRPLPAILDADTLAQAVKDTDKLFLTTAPTGKHIFAALAKIGLGDIVREKLTAFDRATEMLEALSREDAPVLAFGPTTEIAGWRNRGIADGGVLPAKFDLPLAYAAAILNSSTREAQARDVLDYIAGSAGLAHFRTSGVRVNAV